MLGKKKIAIICILIMAFTNLTLTEAHAGVWQDLGNWVGESVNTVTTMVSDAGEWVGEKTGAAREWVGEKTGAVREWVGEKTGAVREWINITAVSTILWIDEEIEIMTDWIREKSYVLDELWEKYEDQFAAVGIYSVEDLANALEVALLYFDQVIG